MQEVALAAVAQRRRFTTRLEWPFGSIAWRFVTSALPPQDGKGPVAGGPLCGPQAPSDVDGSASPLAWILCNERQRLVQEASMSAAARRRIVAVEARRRPGGRARSPSGWALPWPRSRRDFIAPADGFAPSSPGWPPIRGKSA